MLHTTRLSDDIVALAESVGDHPEPTEYEADPVQTKVVTASSKGVRKK